ncbi:MAG: extracellular solute-binding protein, partial [Treponema sp.]|nr:extracellular solute-binding protein [Treponema sp.]
MKKFHYFRRGLCLALVVFAAGGLFARGQGSTGGQVKSLKALVPNSASDMNDPKANPVYTYINEATGYTVTYDPLPQDRPADKLNAIIAAGAQEYDFIVLAGGWKDRYAEYAIQGALFDIGAVFNNYQHLQAIPKTLIDVVKVNNTFYALPSLSPSGRQGSANADQFLLWRTDILALMGKKMPATLDEFTSLLQAYKDQDPMKNGSANVPLTVTIGDLFNLRTSSIGGAFGVDLNWKEQGGTLVPYQTQAGFFEFLQYLHTLYERGLLDTEMPINNTAAVREKFTTNKALCRVDGWWDIPGLVATFKQVYPGATMEFGQPLERNGVAGVQANSNNQIDLFCVLPRNAKNWRSTMDFLNKKMEPAVFKEMVIGKEGVDHTVNAQGGYDPILPTFFDHRGNANWYLTGTPIEYNQYWLCRAKKDPDQYKAYSQVNYDYGKFVNVNPASDVPCTIFVNIATANSLSANLTEEFTVNAVVGGVSRAQFNSFVA